MLELIELNKNDSNKEPNKELNKEIKVEKITR